MMKTNVKLQNKGLKSLKMTKWLFDASGLLDDCHAWRLYLVMYVVKIGENYYD